MMAELAEQHAWWWEAAWGTLIPAGLVALLAASALLLLLYLYHHRYLSWAAARYKLPPGPRPRPVVGNLLDVTPVRFKCFQQWAATYGPVMSVWMGSTLNVVVSSAEAAKEVLKQHDQHLAARARSRAAAKFSRDGQDLIWADYGPHYVKVRKVCNLELFSPKRLEALRPIRESEASALVHKIRRDCGQGRPVNPRTYLSAAAFNHITRLAFGKRFVDDAGTVDAQGTEFKEIIGQGMRLGASLKISEHIPAIRWLFPLRTEEFARHGARRDALTRAIMRDHSEVRAKAPGGGGAAAQEQHHFVDALLTLQQQYDLSETAIIGLLWDMVTAGMDTVAITVEWALAELIRNPQVQRKAQAELDAVIGTDRVLTELDFPRLPYLAAITKESLRLHPPTPLMLPHKCTQHVKIQGYDIPQGTVVHCNVYVIARDPAVWTDPLAFKPERFIEQEDVDIKGHDFRVLPFGAGRRVCPGAQLGLNMAQLLIGRLLHQFSWAPPPGVDPKDISLEERSGIVAYMAASLEAVATPRLPDDALYAC